MGAGADRPALSRRSAELALAAFLLAVGALVVWDSARLGAGWADDGPQAGYFPFYIGALICAASAVNGARALGAAPALRGAFASRAALRRVLAVLAPTALFAAAVGWLGLYLASVLFVAGFMRACGRAPWWRVAAVSLGQALCFFALFEIWFQVPLPKGPLEVWLGLA